MEDKDIKIFKKVPKEDSIDENALFEEMNTQRANGNTEKAKMLGQFLANEFIDESKLLASLESVLGKLDYPEQIVYQMKILMFFTAEYLINMKLPNSLLKITTINILYDSIKDDASDFYNEFSDGVEYSFYYLAIKKENIADEIGATFSMICHKENEEKYTKLGKELFLVVSHRIEDIINSYDFLK